MGSGSSKIRNQIPLNSWERQEEDCPSPKHNAPLLSLEEDNPDRYLPINGLFLLDNEFYEKIKKGGQVKAMIFNEPLNHKDKLDILCTFLLKIKYLSLCSESMSILAEDISREILSTLDISYAYFAYIKQTSENELNPEDLKIVISCCVELYYFLYFLKIDVDSMFDDFKWWHPDSDISYADSLCFSIINICKKDKKFRVEVFFY